MYNEILERAMELGQKRHPSASGTHHAAFANSVAYLLTGESGGYGGPSMREHLACSQAANLALNCTFEQAVAAVEQCCYGPFTIAHARMIEQDCFDDAAGEVQLARALLDTAGRQN